VVLEIVDCGVEWLPPASRFLGGSLSRGDDRDHSKQYLPSSTVEANQTTLSRHCPKKYSYFQCCSLE
jgi:hypothetical protein